MEYLKIKIIIKINGVIEMKTKTVNGKIYEHFAYDIFYTNRHYFVKKFMQFYKSFIFST